MSVTFVTHRRFAVVFFVPSCCVSSLLISHRDTKLLNHNTVKPVYNGPSENSLDITVTGQLPKIFTYLIFSAKLTCM